MKKIRVFAVLLLCVALLAFAGCGEKKSDQDTENGTDFCLNLVEGLNNQPEGFCGDSGSIFQEYME